MRIDPDEIEGNEVGADFDRQVPFSMTPHWIALATKPDGKRVSSRAVHLYVLLTGHVNNRRGDSAVWPTNAQLADMLGLRRADDVKPYVDELISINAIERQTVRVHGGMRQRNVYVVLGTAPPGWEGPESIPEWHRRNRDQEASSQVTPEPGKNRGPETGKNRVRENGDHRAPDPWKTRGELQEPQQDEDEQGTSSLRSSVPRAGAGAREGGEDAVPGPDGRTERGNTRRPRTVQVQGERIDLSTVRLPDGRAIEVADADRQRAEELRYEDDREWIAPLQQLMSRTQQRRFLDLLPRACAVADADRVRGWLHAKTAEAQTAVYVLGAFSDDRIEDVIEAAPVAHPEVRAERARQAEEEAREAVRRREAAINATAEGHWGRPASWGPQNDPQGDSGPWSEAAPSSAGAGDAGMEGREQGSAPVADDRPDPAADLLRDVGAEFEPTPRELSAVRVALDDHGHEPVRLTIKGLLASGGENALRHGLRGITTFRRAVAEATA